MDSEQTVKMLEEGRRLRESVWRIILNSRRLRETGERLTAESRRLSAEIRRNRIGKEWGGAGGSRGTQITS